MDQPRDRRRAHPKPYTGRGLGHLFEDFDAARVAVPDPPPAPPAPEEPPDLVPYFTEQEIAAARREGYEAGMEDRRASTLRDHDVALERALSTIVSAMEDANAVAERMAQEAAEGVAKLLLRSLATVLPALCARHGADEIDAVVQTILPRLKAEPRVVIELHPDASDAVRSRLGGFAHDLVDHIDLVPSPNLAGGDVRIAWQNGEAVRDSGALWRDVAAVLASFGLLDEQDLAAASPKPTKPVTTTPAAPTATAVSLTRENADVE